MTERDTADDWTQEATEAARGAVATGRRPSWAGAPTDDFGVVATRLKVALVVLPSTSDGIAHLLDTMRVRGYQGMSHDCPLSGYLTVFVGHQVLVGLESITVTNGREWGVEVRTPGHAANFLRGFDAGEYPGLIRPED